MKVPPARREADLKVRPYELCMEAGATLHS